ncbi:hypothetical protein U0C82_03150 [Fulvimarina sp. 2208YS6-2-32]|uniref:Aldehyde dehydrogenase family protein n=1 Tax=Fulvimarina uroteuthidis TaxID=3098149 RepID=A0ABU5HZB6_9HYPH|nr:hypothetical protein [Fulvimarina sp. 2208YS6-2-32]MDY8108145.1 hypothetical protein [Fulvimarina sp. 2208YS6-2-32]
MTDRPAGPHFIAGQTLALDATFRSDPIDAEPRAFSQGSPEPIDKAAKAAEEAFAPFSADASFGEGVFGPLGIVVSRRHMNDVTSLAKALRGQPTLTLHMAGNDAEDARGLRPIIGRKAGRDFANGLPTGVQEAGAMVPGGPCPASTTPGPTSFGPRAIRRFLRPVCFQNIPQALPPVDLRS